MSGSYEDAYNEAMRSVGVPEGQCVVCGQTFFVETGYHEMGLCGGCVKRAAHEYSMAHSGAPDANFSPPEAMEQYLARFPPKRGKDKIPHALRKAVFERDAYRCKLCGDHHELHADHAIPESKGGATSIENLQTLCAQCNLKKGASLPALTGEKE